MFFFFLRRNHTILIQKCTIWHFRRKYELLQFMECGDNLSCQIVPSQGRSLTLAHSSSSCHHPPMDKKHYEKKPTKHHIGLTFRNSRGRKDSEHKSSSKRSTSLVIFHLINASSIIHLSNKLSPSFWNEFIQQNVLALG